MHPYGVLQDTVNSVMVTEFMSRTDINCGSSLLLLFLSPILPQNYP